REEEAAACSGSGLDPDPPAVALDDLLADREADPGPGVLVASVEALEGREDALGVLEVDPDAVVAHAEDPLGVLALHADPHLGHGLAAELDRVADQVLE